MPKIITEIPNGDDVKMVQIKHTRSAIDAEGNDIEVLDYTENNLLSEALTNAETKKASIESQLAAVNQEITELETIRDAE
tara:strand:- start:3462 stop:3701 length:240 start_codon:yes stop_codon:yes gene_type:complete